MDDRGPRPVDQWDPHVAVFVLPLRLLIWLLRIPWLVAKWTVIVIGALVVTGWSAVEEGVREFGRTLAGGFRSPSALRGLPRNLLEFHRRRKRTRAAQRRSYRYMGESNVVGIIRELQELPDQDVGANALSTAAFGAYRLGDPRAAPYVLPLLTHPDDQTRWAAVRTIGTCKFRDAEEFVRPMLHDHSALVRMETASTLGKIGGAEARELVRTAMREDADQWVRLYAARALIELGELVPDTVVQGELLRARALPWWRRKSELIQDWETVGAGRAPDA